MISVLLAMAVAVSASTLLHAVEEKPFEPAEVPESLSAKLEGLSEEEINFLLGEKALSFAERHDILFDRLSSKSPEAIAAYVRAMIRVTELSKFNPETDMASIPLNTESGGFNRWRIPRPAEFDTPREPGPININRYFGSGPKLGIPTFLNMPVAVTPQDLVAGEVEVAIMGVPLDTGTGFRGAAYGPRSVRTGNIYKGASPVEPQHMHTMVSPTNELRIVDYGDIAVDQLSLERSIGHIRKMVRDVAAAGAIPMIVGGDHSLMYPDVAGVVDVYGPGNVGVVHFDAHYDAGRGSPHLLSHGQPVHRLFSEGLVPGPNFIQVGLRGYWPSKAGFEWMREHGLRYHTMAEIEKDGWDQVMKRAMKEVLEGPEYIYISFDIDVLDPAYAPGTGTPEPAGPDNTGSVSYCAPDMRGKKCGWL